MTKKTTKQQYKNLEMDDQFLYEMENEMLIQAFSAIIRNESYVELYPLLDGIHKSLMELN